MTRSRPTPPSYRDRLVRELAALQEQYAAVLDASQIIGTGMTDSMFIGFARWDWRAADDDLAVMLMRLLGDVRDLGTRLRLLFDHPTPQVSARLDEGLGLLERWLNRPGSDHSVPGNTEAARSTLASTIEDLRGLLDLTPADPVRVRLVVDTNALIDQPDLAAYVPVLGDAYVAHLLPVVLRELDDLKRGGRIPELREGARRAERRLKALRDNGDVRAGARVSGQVVAVFEVIEPRDARLPSWLDLTVPDDRLVASALLLQSRHPGSALYVATGDLNLQTKLTAVGLPFVEPPDPVAATP